MHEYFCLKALEYNKNVLVEKPCTCSYKETQELINIAKKNKLSIVETFQFRFHKQFEFIKQIIFGYRIITNNSYTFIQIIIFIVSWMYFDNKVNITFTSLII